MDTLNLGTEEDKREVKVGANLEPSVKERLIQLLHEYVEVFAWSYEDISGLDADIVVHRLPTKEDCPPVKQKVHRMRPDMSEKIKAEVMKQFNAGFLGRHLLSAMGFQCCSRTQERRQGTNVHGLQRFE